MRLDFTKMHGLGNDFVVINGLNQSIQLQRAQLQRLADRHLGVGCDQILLIEPAQQADVDFRYRIFNADGGEVEQCGNGARCFARYVHECGLTDKTSIRVETMKGILTLVLRADGQVTVDMGIPQFEPAAIPFEATLRANHYMLDINGQAFKIGAVSMGNPHAVMQVDNIEQAPVHTLGPLLEAHPAFPNRVNAGFLQIDSRSTAHIRVYERGAGETLACGSGACAAVVIGRLWGLLDESVHAHLLGGTLTISWQGEGQPVYMTGPAEFVFEGSIEL